MSWGMGGKAKIIFEKENVSCQRPHIAMWESLQLWYDANMVHVLGTCMWSLLYHRPQLLPLSRMKLPGLVSRRGSLSASLAFPLGSPSLGLSLFLQVESKAGLQSLTSGQRLLRVSLQGYSVKSIYFIFLLHPINCNHDWTKGYLCPLDTFFLPSDQNKKDTESYLANKIQLEPCKVFVILPYLNS